MPKKIIHDKFEINIKNENYLLTDCSRLLDEILNRKPNKNMAYVGVTFSHKGGLHAQLSKKILKLTSI